MLANTITIVNKSVSLTTFLKCIMRLIVLYHLRWTHWSGWELKNIQVEVFCPNFAYSVKPVSTIVLEFYTGTVFSIVWKNFVETGKSVSNQACALTLSKLPMWEILELVYHLVICHLPLSIFVTVVTVPSVDYADQRYPSFKHHYS